ncbi:MAG: hypothetical protein NUV84_04915 [Candidatus Uhrbacteria bacterium]|nr:hypothetical protein [Candidatus Uhrbacteria bacterium]
MKLFKRAFIAIGLVLVLHGILLLTNGYAIDQIDTPMHFLGGFVMTLLGLAIHHSVASKYHTKHSPVWYHYTFVIGFAMLIGIAWEFHEYLFDQTINSWYNLPRAQLSLADTMKDFLMDWLGASVAFFWFRKQF